MRPTVNLLPGGQSLWMDNHLREIIHDGSLEEYSITGLLLNSESLKKAVVEGSAYDDIIMKRLRQGVYGELLACSLILDDLSYAADLLRHIHDRSDGVDGWAILPASPLVSDTPDSLTRVFLNLNKKVHRPNVLIRLPVVPAGEIL